MLNLNALPSDARYHGVSLIINYIMLKWRTNKPINEQITRERVSYQIPNANEHALSTSDTEQPCSVSAIPEVNVQPLPTATVEITPCAGETRNGGAPADRDLASWPVHETAIYYARVLVLFASFVCKHLSSETITITALNIIVLILIFMAESFFILSIISRYE